MLFRSKTEISGSKYTSYALANGDNGVALYPNANSFVSNSHNAYLAVEAAQGAAYYTFNFNGATAIEEIETIAGNKTIYDLTGRKIEAITAPGLYIINGVKTFVE